jgi:hypothetical protein
VEFKKLIIVLFKPKNPFISQIGLIWLNVLKVDRGFLGWVNGLPLCEGGDFQH